MTKIFKSADELIELRCGRWQDVLADVGSVDAVITDPPYSKRTHSGNDRMGDFDRADIAYACLAPKDVRVFCDHWGPRASGWIVAMTDDALSWIWRRCLERAGRYSFASVSLIQHRPRLGGDGPGSCTVHIQTARPRARSFQSWGSLPGWYKDNPEKMPGVNGAKPIKTMRALVRDYSRPGDLICDPCAGSGTTLIAAAIEGRRAIGAEMDPETYAKAVTRIKRGYTTAIALPLRAKAKQEALL